MGIDFLKLHAKTLYNAINISPRDDMLPNLIASFDIIYDDDIPVSDCSMKDIAINIAKLKVGGPISLCIQKF